MLDWALPGSVTVTEMAEFLVKLADERGHLSEQVEHGYSEAKYASALRSRATSFTR